MPEKISIKNNVLTIYTTPLRLPAVHRCLKLVQRVSGTQRLPAELPADAIARHARIAARSPGGRRFLLS